MEFYKVYERRNGEDFNHLRDVYLTEIDAEKRVSNPTKSQHLETINGKDVWVKDKYEYEIVKTEIDEPKFDVYYKAIRGGHRVSELTYENAKAMYEKAKKAGKSVIFQIPLNQFGSLGCSTIEDSTTTEFKIAEKAYWKSMEEEENAKYYSASNPWDAPGMSIHDFI